MSAFSELTVLPVQTVLTVLPLQVILAILLVEAALTVLMLQVILTVLLLQAVLAVLMLQAVLTVLPTRGFSGTTPSTSVDTYHGTKQRPNICIKRDTISSFRMKAVFRHYIPECTASQPR